MRRSGPPALHFVAAGIALFALERLAVPRGRSAPAVPPPAPLLTPDRLAQLRADFTRQEGVAPTPGEEQALAAQAMDDEILYREALTRGLDRGDASIRYRLAEKMRFLADGEDGGDEERFYHDALALHLERDDLFIRRMLTTKMRLLAERGEDAPAPDDAELQAYLDRLGVTLESGWRAEINLNAVAWVRDAARRLARGFMILIDYGHDARELYSAAHSLGTLTSYSAHRAAGADSSSAPAWLQRPGEQDITAHVDFTSVRAAAEAEGMTTIGFLDQTYFLLGLLGDLPNPQSAIRNPQFKTLIVPGGLGSTQKVLILGKGVGSPALRGLSFRVRVT